jgi:endothelin-converting enzyme/putative endopeptidase
MHIIRRFPATVVVLIMMCAALAQAQNATKAAPAAKETPLQAMPYTPSLDVAAMDKSADPCVDLYQYSCGGWKKNNPIPADQAGWSVYAKLAQDNERLLWGILADDAKMQNRNDVQQKIGDYFASCMDESAINRAGLTPLKPELERIAALQSKKDLTGYLAQAHLSVSSNFLFNANQTQDYGDAEKVIVGFDAGGLGLPDRDYYTRDKPKDVEARAKYVAYIEQMLTIGGESPAQAKADAQAIMKMETDLAKASLTRVEKREPHNLYHMMSLEQLQASSPAIDWSAFLADENVTAKGDVNVSEPAFYKELSTVIQNESMETLRAYFRFHLINAAAPYLSSNIAAAQFDFYSKYLRGVEQMPPRWKRCVRQVDRFMGEDLGQEFVRVTFTPDTKAKTVRMTDQIETAMAGEIKSLDWMSDQTKQLALVKLHGIRNKVGYPDRWRDYSALTITPNDYFGNVRRSIAFEERREWNKVGKPLDRNEWGMTPPTVNAYYDPQMNDINFPAGVLQPPLYDPKMDAAPNYGNTGGTIGHELTHGFDDEGRQFDAQGNLKDWWTAEDAKKFEDRINCVRDQYAQYIVVDDIHINSKLTSGEDVADLGGELLAYIAWQAETQGQNLQPMDGFTPDQRFFIGFAQWACENERPENLREHAFTDPHSPGKDRINGVVVNMPQFAKAFGCKAGQPMVKEASRVCRVW